MKYQQLGDSDLLVSKLCVGTMTYGHQNTYADLERNFDYLVAQGVNFIDTSETYPFPNPKKILGLTEEYLGKWLAKQKRDQLIIATKIAGVNSQLTWIRNGKNRIDKANVTQAVEASLKRLQTDYIDLYQIHWPDRYVPLFGQPDYNPQYEQDTVPIAEQLEVFADLIKEGKIRYLGVSNETAWGICEFCHVAKQLNLPKIVSIQNAFSLFNRTFHLNLAEACRFNNIGLLAYNPLAFGFLTGKYLSGIPKHSRLDSFGAMYSHYNQTTITQATQSYVNLAHKYNITPAQLALAYVTSRWFVTSAIVGATKIQQLEENVSSIDVELDGEILQAIEEVHRLYPNPTT